MSLADEIVWEFRSGIISSLVPPPNPPVARNGNKRSNSAYVRHEDWSESVDRRYVPLVPPRWRHEFLCASEKSFSECSCNRNIDFGSQVDFCQTLACRQVHFHSTPDQRISKSDCSVSFFMWIVYMKYLSSQSDSSMTFKENTIDLWYSMELHGTYWLQWTIAFVLPLVLEFFLRMETRNQNLVRSQK